MSKASSLSRRERQIMDVVYELGEASAQEVLEKLPEPPGYSAVRAMLRKLEDKGHLGHKEAGPKYIFFPLLEREQASRNAITRLVKTFFNGSTGKAANALLGQSLDEISDEELQELEMMIQAARKKNR